MNVLCGQATIDLLFENGLLHSPSDLYSLSLELLKSLDGWEEQSARLFLDSLQGSKNVPFERVLFAIGIRFVGETTARDVARHFGSIEALSAASLEELLEVQEVGGVIADSIFQFFRSTTNLKEIERLKAAGLQFSIKKQEQLLSDALSGKTFVISGNFSISRDAMKALIEAHGGKNSSAVSGKTDYLLAGTKPGPEKLKKAADLGVAVIDEAAFRALISQTSGYTSPDAEGRDFPESSVFSEPTLF